MLEEIEDQDVLEQLHAIVSEIRRMKLSFDGIGTLDQPLVSHKPEAIDYACREAGAVMKHRAKNANAEQPRATSETTTVMFPCIPSGEHRAPDQL